jgi:hypothetical protein
MYTASLFIVTRYLFDLLGPIWRQGIRNLTVLRRQPQPLVKGMRSNEPNGRQDSLYVHRDTTLARFRFLYRHFQLNQAGGEVEAAEVPPTVASSSNQRKRPLDSASMCTGWQRPLLPPYNHLHNRSWQRNPTAKINCSIGKTVAAAAQKALLISVLALLALLYLYPTNTQPRSNADSSSVMILDFFWRT